MTDHGKKIMGFFVLLVMSYLGSFAGNAAASVRVSWIQSGQVQQLQSWDQLDFARLKRIRSRERDPASSRIVQWEGYLLADIVERTLGPLHGDQKASVDLLIVRGEDGKVAYIPRALSIRFPLLVVPQQSGRSQLDFSLVVPWSSKPKIWNEGLPLENYNVSRLRSIEFTNYKDKFGQFFLKRRTDPFAMRGETHFVQNCVTCHQNSYKNWLPPGSTHSVQKYLKDGHPITGDVALKGTNQLGERDRRSILKYIEAFRLEAASGIYTSKN